MRSSLSDGIVVFQLPSIDLQQLAQRGSPITQWPSEAGQLFDGSVPPWMQWLLMSDEEARYALEKLPEGSRLTQFNVDRDEHREAIVKLAAASQRLLAELASEGQNELQQRLFSALEPQDSEFASELVRGVPPDLFRQAYRDWFEQPSKAVVSSGLRDSTKTSFRMIADQRDERDIRGNSLGLKDDRDLLLSGNDLLGSGSDSLVDNSLLGEAPLKSDPLSDDASALGKTSSSDASHSSDWKPLRPFKHLVAGGWMIDRQRMAIIYVPSGHADPWLTAMLTLAGKTRDKMDDVGPTEPFRGEKEHWTRMTQSILAKDGVGRCLECHQSFQATDPIAPHGAKPVSIQASSYQGIHARWQARRFDARARQLTRFDHGPHLLQPSLTNCVSCHRMVESHSVANGIPHRDFESMTVKDCASCHQPKAAGDNCTQCHNYHTNSIEN